MTFGGDQLARGMKSANFAGASGLSDFEGDLIYRPEVVAEKYGLTQEEVDAYEVRRQAGEKMPNLQTKDFKLSVVDKRHNYMLSIMPVEQAAKVAPKKWPETKQYTSFRPIMDRILVKRVADDPNMEVMEDGSLRDKRTNLVIPGQYRQHSNIGIVLAVGDFVVVGGTKTPLSEVVRPGDRVQYGDYNSEVFHMAEHLIESLCDAVQMNYFTDEEGLRIVRVQDVRGFERPID